MKEYCTHVSCRLDTLQELVFLGVVRTQEGLLMKWQELRTKEVRCRVVPRRGAVDAPFPVGGEHAI